MSINSLISSYNGRLYLFLVAILTVGTSVFVAGPGSTQTTPLSKLNADQPIEITADSLEVKQDQNIAIFQGNVDALQGEIRLRADRLTVYYQNSDNSSTGINAISRIDAEGSVFITSTQETAQGDVGIYDVENGIITLTENVLLTQGENVIRGNSLHLNIVTGQSVVNGGLDATPSGGRVRSLFIPKRQVN
tara:strand:- start:774 stop:1346 length:573 start_codon:yes stop_codon:yes gene_type:complete